MRSLQDAHDAAVTKRQQVGEEGPFEWAILIQ